MNMPDHLTQYSWYLPHLAWLGYSVDAEPKRANLSKADLRGADLSGADLRLADLSEANFRGAGLCEADLRVADLSGADLGGADLSGANLYKADLHQADLGGATGLPAAPVVPGIDQKILEACQDGRRLNMDEWHCGTSHCRAGWAVHLAGEDGYDLEEQTSPYLAGRLIYEASRPGVPCPNFFAGNDAALESLREDAEKYSS